MDDSTLSPTQRSIPDRLVALALFLVSSSVFFASATGITSSNDGSHYALVRALVENGSIEIAPYLAFTENQDYAIYEGRYYSERQPAPSLLAAPFYALSTIGPRPFTELPSKHDRGNPGIPYALMSVAICAGLNVSLIYMLLRRHFGIGQAAAGLAALALAFGTTTWRYAAVLFSHSLTGLAVLGTFSLIFEIERRAQPTPWLSFAASFGVGLAFLSEYHAGLFSAITGLYLAYVVIRLAMPALSGHGDRRAALGSLAGLVLGVGLTMAFWAWYNLARFDQPLAFSYNYLDPVRWPEHQSGLSNQFQVPLWVGLPGMLFTDGINQGFFWLSPVTLLGLPGVFWWLRDLRREGRLLRGIVVLVVLVASLLAFSTSITYNAFTNDSRYLASFTALWFIPVAVCLQRYFDATARGRSHWLLTLLIFGLIWLSIRNQAVHIACSWNYDLNPASLRPLSINPGNLAYFFGILFRNTGNLPLLWAVYTLIGLAIAALRWLVRRAPAGDRPQA